MRIMIRQYVVLVILVIFLATLSFIAGNMIGKRKTSLIEYDFILSELGDDIFVNDAITTDHSDKAIVLIHSQLESNFYRLVKIREQHDFKEFRDMRCAITRRIRKLKSDGIIFNDRKALEEGGISVRTVESYLENDCPGEPAKVNWADLGEN